MFKRIRVAILLYVLLFVSVGGYLARSRSTDWNEPLWINAYATPAMAGTSADVQFAGPDELAAIEAFLAAQAVRYGVALDRPFRFNFAGPLSEPLPPLPTSSSVLAAIRWSLAMRWRAAMLDWLGDEPTPDIVLFVTVHAGGDGVSIERSGALRQGLIAVAHIFGDRAARGSNRVVIAHELLHTLGATDKYDPRTNLPLHPVGYADPARIPLHPQVEAELMGGRIPIDRHEAKIPAGLDDVVIGPATAFEIGWLTELPPAAGHAD
jgi:hypothetical protein